MIGNSAIDKKADKRFTETAYGMISGSEISDMYSQVHGPTVDPKIKLNNPNPNRTMTVPA
jgi:hypothetical protein